MTKYVADLVAKYASGADLILISTRKYRYQKLSIEFQNYKNTLMKYLILLRNMLLESMINRTENIGIRKYR